MPKHAQRRPPRPDPEILQPTPEQKRVIAVEDVVNLAAIGLLFALTILPLGGWRQPLLVVLLVVVGVLFVRRKTRVDRLFAELRRQQEAMERGGPVPFIPGVPMPQDRMGPTDANNGKRETVKRNGRPHGS